MLSGFCRLPLWSVSVALFSQAATSADLGRRADGDICFSWYNRVAVVGDRLFIINGEYTIEPNESASAQPDLYSLDLSSPFAVETSIPLNNLSAYAFPDSLTNGYNSGSLWHWNDMLYIWNGNNSGDSLTTFDVTNNQWDVISVSGTGVDGLTGGSRTSVSSPDSALSFSFGTTSTMPSFVRFDASDPKSPVWSNQTTSGTQGISVPAIQDSELVYVPLGKWGILVQIGGGYFQAINGAIMVPMSSISIYDIDSSSWYSVTATGDEIPEPRGSFCAIVSESPDRSSFQITVYGGWNPDAVLHYEDVWVLTIPSFRWVRISTIDDVEANPTLHIGRAHHTCALYGGAEMIVIGGSIRFGSAPRVNETSCQPEYPPIRVLDTSTYTWKSTFELKTSYTVAKAVTDIIGGDAYGGANITEPEGGWPYTELQAIMALNVTSIRGDNSTTITASASSTALTTSSASSSPSSPSSPSSSNASPGAIAGGVIGGVAAVVALLIALFLWRRKRAAKIRATRTQYEKPELSASQDHKSPVGPNSNLQFLQPGTAPRGISELDPRSISELDPRGISELSETRPTYELPAHQSKNLNAGNR